MRQPRPLRAPRRACVSLLARWRESQPEMAMVQARDRSIFPFAVQYQRLAATNRALAAAEGSTRTAAAESRETRTAQWRETVIPSEVEESLAVLKYREMSPAF